MKAAVYVGAGSVELREWPRPSAGPGELLLKVNGCGLCGTDIGKILKGEIPPPMVFGHEVVGTVVDVGGGIEEFRVGDRLVVAHHVPCFTCHYCRRGSPSMCRTFKAMNLDPGGFAEYVRVPAPNVKHATFRIPGDLSDEAASFTEPLACCLRAVKRARVEPGDSALVVGLGSIGCLFVQLIRRAGLSVLAADLDPRRQALGRGFGAVSVGQPDELESAVAETTGGRGVDVVVVTAGGAPVLSWVAPLVRDGGSLHYFAGGDGEHLPLPLETLYRRELTLTTTYSSSPAELGEAFDLLARRAVRVDQLITHRLPLDRLAEGVALMTRRQAVKVFVVPDPTGSTP
jgi:L-iditol 2-dehydrogenase